MKRLLVCAAVCIGTLVSAQPAEGRQGPYQLIGTGGEPVRILAGTEKIWLDGRLLQRGLPGEGLHKESQGGPETDQDRIRETREG